jgi:hypothetical protein
MKKYEENGSWKIKDGIGRLKMGYKTKMKIRDGICRLKISSIFNVCNKFHSQKMHS